MTQPVTTPPRRVLFLCTGNSCRSQMAEGLLRELSRGGTESLSAGALPSGYVHPMAIEVMGELEIDISGQHSKSIDEFLEPAETIPHVVISVCDSAAARCPVFPGREVQRLHWPIDDPADATGTDDQKRAQFRRVRDEIRLAIEEYLGGAGCEM
jgi:arsenate reductase